MTSSRENLTKRLITHWQSQRLGHFYIIRPCLVHKDIGQNIFQLKEWTKDFLERILQTHYQCSLPQAKEKLKLGHSDILWITPSSEKSYSVKTQELQELQRFQNYGALELNQRFVIVEQSHRINEALTNKLLKDLEEPKEKTSIFFLDPTHTQLLSTLRSRALLLNLPHNEAHDSSDLKKIENLDQIIEYLEQKIAFYAHKDSKNENKDELNCLTLLREFCSKTKQDSQKEKVKNEWMNWALGEIKKKQIPEQSLQTWWIEIESLKNSSFKHKEANLKILNWAEMVKKFHNPLATRNSEILSQLLLW